MKKVAKKKRKSEPAREKMIKRLLSMLKAERRSQREAPVVVSVELSVSEAVRQEHIVIVVVSQTILAETVKAKRKCVTIAKG